ncbi:MAG: type II toxin-antitoxin system VapC family toxin [Candidatus Aminicenantes bacterium]
MSQNLIVAAHQAITNEWWEKESSKYTIYISQFVLDEASEGDHDASRRRLDFLAPFLLLEATDEVLELTKTILNTPFFPQTAIRDASHIAIAAVHGVEYLLTWNCKHINNATFKEKLRKVCEQQGYRFPIICTPEELMEEMEDNNDTRPNR